MPIDFRAKYEYSVYTLIGWQAVCDGIRNQMGVTILVGSVGAFVQERALYAAHLK